MPSSSTKQRKWIFTQRSKYGSKEKTPKDMKFIWDDEYKKIEEGNREEKYWITNDCELIKVPRFKYHKDYVDDYNGAIRDGWIRVLIGSDDCIHCVCDKIDNHSVLKIHKFLKQVKDVDKYPIFVNENGTNKIKAYRPMMKEEITSIKVYEKVFNERHKTVDGYQSPEGGEDISDEDLDILSKTYASCRKGSTDKEKCSKIAWSQVNK